MLTRQEGGGGGGLRGVGAERGGGDRADVTPECEGEGGGLRGVGATGRM